MKALWLVLAAVMLTAAALVGYSTLRNAPNTSTASSHLAPQASSGANAEGSTGPAAPRVLSAVSSIPMPSTPLDRQMRQASAFEVAEADPPAAATPVLKITAVGDADALPADLPSGNPDGTRILLDKPLQIVVEGTLSAGNTITADAKKGDVTIKADAVLVNADQVTAKQAIVRFGTEAFLKPGYGVYTINAQIDNTKPTAFKTPDVRVDLQPKTTLPNTVRIDEVSEGAYPWKTPATNRRLLNTQKPITAKVIGVTKPQVVSLVQPDGQNYPDPAIPAAVTDKSATISLSKEIPTGMILRTRASIGWSKSAESTETLTAPSAELRDPTITDTQNGKYAQPVAFSGTSVKIYDGYLHIRGQRGPAGGTMRFVVQKEGDAKGLYDLTETATPSETGEWSVTLDLNQKGVLPNSVRLICCWGRSR